MTVTAALVKELRERTGAGMMECKKILVEVGGDIETAIEEMRKSGMAKADKKAGRVAADGLVVVATDNGSAAIVEVNCETDFVAKGDDFAEFATQIAELVAKEQPADVDALNALALPMGKTVDERRRELIAKIGENMTVRRFQIVKGDVLGAYSHGGRIGAVVSMTGGDEALARDVAMHVAASKPQFVNVDHVPADAVAREKDILIAQAADSGKPAEIIEKMVEGRLRKHLGEITLYGQAFIKDPDQTVEKLVGASNATVNEFVRLDVGEGIEKEETDFVAEVQAQASAA